MGQVVFAVVGHCRQVVVPSTICAAGVSTRNSIEVTIQVRKKRSFYMTSLLGRSSRVVGALK
jgi:hypothetical protein